MNKLPWGARLALLLGLELALGEVVLGYGTRLLWRTSRISCFTKASSCS